MCVLCFTILLVTRKRYLIDGIGLVSWLFWEFFPREVKNIIFAWRGVREVCLKWTSENSELRKTQIFFLGRGEHWWVWQGVGVMWGGLCEVGYVRWGAGCRGHVRWVAQGGSHKVGYTRWIMQGGLCEVGGRVWGSHKVGYVRWVMQGGGQDVGVTWGGLRKVDHTRWVTQGGSRKVGYARLHESPSEMFLSLIFHKSRALRNIPSAK